MRHFCLTKNNTPIEPPCKIISLENYANGESSWNTDEDIIFDDYTTNFTDCGYWNSDDIHGLNIDNVIKYIKNKLKRMETDGHTITKQEYSENMIKNPSWIWGHREKNENEAFRDYYCDRDLPFNEKCDILMYHLTNILSVLNDYDKTYNIFMD